MKHIAKYLTFFAMFALMATLPGFSAGAQGNYARAHANAAALEALFPKDRSGEPIYPDFIGGIYYNDDHNMVLQLVESAKAKDPAQYSRVENFLAQADGIIVEHVDFSDNELNAVMDTLDSFWLTKNKPDVFDNVDTYKKDTINNRVEIWLRNYNEREIARFREVALDSPMLIFVKSRGAPTIATGGTTSAPGGGNTPTTTAPRGNSLVETQVEGDGTSIPIATQDNQFAETQTDEIPLEGINTEGNAPASLSENTSSQITSNKKFLWALLILAGIGLLSTGTILWLRKKRSRGENN